MTFAIEGRKGIRRQYYLSYGVVLALQAAFGAVLLVMRHANAGLVACRSHCERRFDPREKIKTPENAPIEITSTGETTYEIVWQRRAIMWRFTWQYRHLRRLRTIQFHHDDVELRGHVRIYRDLSLYVADSGVLTPKQKRSGL